MRWQDQIVSTSDTLHGAPRFRDTLIPVSVVLDKLAAGTTPEELYVDYPTLPPQAVQAARAYAVDRVRRRMVAIVTALVGLGTWVVCSRISGRAEAWDGALFFIVGLPLMMAVSALAGFAAPERWWLWSVTIVVPQALVLFSTGPGGPLWVVGALTFAFIAAVMAAMAAGGAALRSSISRRGTG